MTTLLQAITQVTHSSSLLLLFLLNISAYLCPCHNFYLPSPSIPGSKRNQEESGNGGEVASVEEGVGNPQEPCAETEVHHKEKAKEYVHRFYLVEPSILWPKRPQPGTTKRQFLGHSQTSYELPVQESREFSIRRSYCACADLKLLVRRGQQTVGISSSSVHTTKASNYVQFTG